MLRSARSALPLILPLAAVLLAGCGREDEIRQYSVPAETPPDLSLFASTPADGPKGRTLGAIVPHGPTTWFFKMQGPDGPVQDQMEEFLELVTSVKLGDGPDAKPEWTLPEGWTQEPGRDMRFATLKTGGQAPQEVSVIPLPGDAADEEYLLANVNRWRSELGLRKVGAKGLLGESRQAETRRIDVHGKQVVLVNLVGVLQAKGSGAPFAPFAGGGRSPARGTEDDASGAVKPDELTYTTPDGWKPGRLSPPRKAAFTVSDGDRTAEITVIDLPAQGLGGDALANVNRWRGQLKLDPIDKAELDRTASPLAVDGLEGRFVELVGPKQADGSQESILAVMVVRGGTAWFIKLQGDAALAAREKAKFEQFAKSVRFR